MQCQQERQCQLIQDKEDLVGLEMDLIILNQLKAPLVTKFGVHTSQNTKRLLFSEQLLSEDGKDLHI